jgi:hypothetical protein
MGKRASTMAAGLTDKLWDMADVVKMIDDYEERQKAERAKRVN